MEVKQTVVNWPYSILQSPLFAMWPRIAAQILLMPCRIDAGLFAFFPEPDRASGGLFCEVALPRAIPSREAVDTAF